MMLRLLRVAFSQELGQRLKVASDHLRLLLQVLLLWLLLLVLPLQQVLLLWLLLLVLPLQQVPLRQLNLRLLLL